VYNAVYICITKKANPGWVYRNTTPAQNMACANPNPILRRCGRCSISIHRGKNPDVRVYGCADVATGKMRIFSADLTGKMLSCGCNRASNDIVVIMNNTDNSQTLGLPKNS